MIRQAKVASTKNFILIRKEDEKLQKDADFILLHGKQQSNFYNLHFMPPFNKLTAFAVSLISCIKKSYS